MDIDDLARAATGMTKAEAHRQGICIICKKPAPPRIHTVAGEREYRISGTCEDCFDEMFGEEG